MAGAAQSAKEAAASTAAAGQERAKEAAAASKETAAQARRPCITISYTWGVLGVCGAGIALEA
jgi:hypothetical protein